MENEKCTCGNEHPHTHILTEKFITLPFDEGDVTCAIVTTFVVDTKEYIALLPLDENGEADYDDMLFYGFTFDANGEGNHELTVIEDDDTLEAVIDRFDEWLDECEFEKLEKQDIN